MKQLIAILIFSFGSLSAEASSDPTDLGTIIGQVMDQEFKDPIPYATISVPRPKEKWLPAQ